MKKLTILIIALQSFLTLTFSQSNHVFNAIIIEGNVLLKNGNESQKLTPNTKIFDNFSLTLTGKSYVALIHQTGKTLEIQKEGTYKVSDLSKMITDELHGYTNKYTDFLFEKESEKSDHTKIAAVKRPAEKIQILAPIDSKIITSKQFTIHWSSNLPKEVVYNVKVTDIMNNIMFSQETTDTSISIDLSQKAKTTFYQVIISAKGYPQSEIALSTHQGNARIEKDLLFIEENYNENNAFDCIVISKFYEKNSLILHAQHYIEKAIKLSPTEGYQEYYHKFLTHYKIK